MDQEPQMEMRSVIVEKIRPLDCIICSREDTAVRLATQLREKWDSLKKQYAVRIDPLVDGSGFKVILYFKTAMAMAEHRELVRNRLESHPVTFDLRVALPERKKPVA